MPPDSPFNIYRGCENRFCIIDDEEQLIKELNQAFRGFFEDWSDIAIFGAPSASSNFRDADSPSY